MAVTPLLLGSLCTLSNWEQTDVSAKGQLTFNPGHPIFKGHFPGQPIVPGVCSTQLIKELVEKAIGRAYRLKQADAIKFLSFINPLVDPVVVVEANWKNEEDRLQVNASIGFEGRIFLKFKGQYC